ncbi:discoidin domain-containing protein [Spirochaeta dissipatitropha]
MKKINSFISIGLLAFVCSVLAVSCATGAARESKSYEFNRINHNGQDLFLSGMNLAWINFASDLNNFNEARFTEAVEDVAFSGGNSIRWWIHVNGAHSPTFDGHKVSGLPSQAIPVMRRALDIAWERGVLIMPVLFSFDLLQVDTIGQEMAERNKLFVQDTEAIQSYIDNALIPLVEEVGRHPALVAWEVFNEPEGMTEYGWTPIKVQMSDVQRFVNMVAGAIHRTNPDALVTNGAWNVRVNSDIENFNNYYSDERLIAAGGDPDGYLDFYQIHYYPEHFGENQSPFHNHASHWGLDKPILIGEFSAKGIDSPRISTSLSPREAYQFALENDYAGALAWTWTGHDGHGNVFSAAPGMQYIAQIIPDAARVDRSLAGSIPGVVNPIGTQVVQMGAGLIADLTDLTEVFYDEDFGTDLEFGVFQNTREDLVTVLIEDGILGLAVEDGMSGIAEITVEAANANLSKTSTSFLVYVIDPVDGDLALLKPGRASSVEASQHDPRFAFDGLPTTRWSSYYEPDAENPDDEWIQVDLGDEHAVNRVVLNWETAHGLIYDILVSSDGEDWTIVASETEGVPGVIEYEFDPVAARYVRIHGEKRGREWGYSLWNFEVYGQPR